MKIRGFRIEPGEVEAALAKHPAVAENAVVTRTDSRGNTMLVAHVVAADGAAPSTAELRRFLLELLPAAMLPAVFEVTDALPLTSNGKVDRKALMAAAGSKAAAGPAFVAPRTRTEQVLAKILCEVLGLERIGVNDDFFALGGASTQALEVAVRANAAGLPLRPQSIFVYGTIAELAAEYGEVAAEAAAPQTAVESKPEEKRNTVIESIGVYLPARTVSTETVMAECVNEIRLPLERLTGIKNRRVAGEDEFSIDLARKAAVDCLARSSYRREEIDLIIACNISRCDGLGHRFTFEPSTASRLRDQCGLVNALAFDISNACAGMFTGIFLADAIRRGGVQPRAGGERRIHHPSHRDRAEGDRVIAGCAAGLPDPGRRGAAVMLERGPPTGSASTTSSWPPSPTAHACALPRPPTGRTAARSCSPTRSRRPQSAVKHAVPYVAAVMQAARVAAGAPSDHVLMHQTSEASLNDAVFAINRAFGEGAAHQGNTVYNLAERGNTATTTHFVALKDYILGNRIKSGDNVVFGITGSGQTVGAALYTFDDLPDRMRRGASVPARPQHLDRRLPHRGYRRRRACASTASASLPPGSRGLPARYSSRSKAATACLDRTSLDRSALGLILHAGVYRDDFLSEPAVASLVAGELGINGDVESPDGPKTFAFDVLNGAVGFLNACQVAAGMIGAGKVEHAMVVAGEVENNAPESGHPLNGISQTGSAILLSRSDGAEGFGRFVFEYHPSTPGRLPPTPRSGTGGAGCRSTATPISPPFT